MTTVKTIALTIWTFVGKVMSLLFNTLSRFVIAFLPRSKCLLISCLLCSDFGDQENKVCHCFHCFPICLPGSDGTGWSSSDVLKRRNITLPTKVRLVRAMVFPVAMFGCESWIIMKAEHWRIDAFELWCWRRLLRVPSTSRRSNQSILKEINPEYRLEKLVLKSNTLANWCDEPTQWKRAWCWERLKAGGERDNVGWDGWMPSLLDGVWVISGSWWQTRKPGVLESMGSQTVRHDWVTELKWTDIHWFSEAV